MLFPFFRRAAVALALGCLTSLSRCTTSDIGSTGAPAENPFAGSPASASETASQTTADTSLLEQLSVERVNEARLKPAAEAVAMGIAVDEGVVGQITTDPKQPLAMNGLLSKTSNDHSADMLNQDYFAHDTLSGITPFQRMNAAGYLFTTAGENLVWRGTTGTINEVDIVEKEQVDLFVDSNIADRDHRRSMLNPNFREVGIGIVRGQFTDAGIAYNSIMQTQDFGTAAQAGTNILGVVYNDLNGNARYDFGEGVANTSVSLDGVTKSTNAGGGYSFVVRDPGTHTLYFVSPNKSLEIKVQAGDPNMKVDLVGGEKIIVNLGLGPL